MVINTTGLTSEKKKMFFFSRKHRGGYVMVWGGISAFGKTELVLLKGRQDSQKYIQMLKDHLLPFVETKEHEFQQDNAPIHVSKATRAFSRSPTCRLWIGLHVPPT